MKQPRDPNKFEPNHDVLPYISRAFKAWSQFYHNYEVKGMEHIPHHGGALLVMYQGLVPIDFWYFGLSLFEERKQVPCALVDRWLMKTPGLAWLTKAVGGVNANPETAEQLLRSGVLVGVSPGGVKEALAGEKNQYRLVWGGRLGFAKLALRSEVPIIPGFTQNIESAFKAPLNDHPFFQQLYDKTRLPLVPIFGLGPLPFPVKLTTHLGPPIVAGPNETPESLAEKTRLAITQLMDAHQDKNASLTELLKDRFRDSQQLF